MSGDLLKVDYDGNANGVVGGNYGIGVTSGVVISPNSPDTAVLGVRIMKAYPTITKLSIPSNVLMNGSDGILYRFSVQAVANDVRVHKLTFNISNVGVPPATVSNYTLRAFTDPNFSIPDTSLAATGMINGGQCYTSQYAGGGTIDVEIYASTQCLNGLTTYLIPAGSTRYFSFTADVANVTTFQYLSVHLHGDAAFPVIGTMGTTAVIDADTNDDFIWSPVSTSTASTIADVDFTNAYMVLGLPATGTMLEILASP